MTHDGPQEQHAAFRTSGANYAQAVPNDTLASKPADVILHEIVTVRGPRPVSLSLDDRHVLHEGSTLRLVYPFTGDGAAFTSSTSTFNQTQHSGESGQGEFHFTVHDDADSEGLAKAVSDLVATADAHVLSKVKSYNELVESQQAAFARGVADALLPRWRRVRAVRGALEQMHVPLGPSTSPQVRIPVRPAPLSMRVIEDAAAAGAPEWTLAEDLADGVIETILGFTTALERLPATADRLLGQDEETLRDVLLLILNANYQGRATGETFIGHGKSDLLLRWENRDAFVGECKMWKGPKALGDGIEQLLTRYTLWRHTRVALVLFIRDPKDATAIITKAHEVVRSHARYDSTIEAGEPDRRGDYHVRASADSQRLARLTLLPVVLGPATPQTAPPPS